MDVPKPVRGEYLDVSYEEINTVYEYEGNKDGIARRFKGNIPNYFKFVSRDEWLNQDISADAFKQMCLYNGYKLLKLYPILHAGWELDSWGAIGIKDGKKVRLETNHGSLIVEDFVGE